MCWTGTITILKSRSPGLMKSVKQIFILEERLKAWRIRNNTELPVNCQWTGTIMILKSRGPGLIKPVKQILILEERLEAWRIRNKFVTTNPIIHVSSIDEFNDFESFKWFWIIQMVMTTWRINATKGQVHELDQRWPWIDWNFGKDQIESQRILYLRIFIV